MRTKLVYVLTCAPEATYIEQALMAVWSARYWNPDAYIVLLTDNKTSEIIHTDLQRGEILKYISEEVVSTFESDKSMHYRSRWIKTQARELVSGDMLFIDCDTICCKPLSEIDSWTMEVGAVGDNNVSFDKDIARVNSFNAISKIGCDMSDEKYYFNSGVMYVKDTNNSHYLYRLWHKYWEYSVSLNLMMDQPGLAKANIEVGHLIKPIANEWNLQLYTQSIYLSSSIIFHIASCRNACYLFGPQVLNYIKNNGLQNWIKEQIIDIHSTYLPHDNLIYHSNLFQRIKLIKKISHTVKLYCTKVDNTCDFFQFRVFFSKWLKKAYSHHLYIIPTCLWMLSRRFTVLRKRNIKDNVCSI